MEGYWIENRESFILTNNFKNNTRTKSVLIVVSEISRVC